ncbi:MAG: pilus assembly protein N-terminal domain-containing protein, partial [Candidatus Angelobacter sp.]
MLATACCLAAQGQTPLSVAYQKTLQLSVAGATAAYSLDPNIADATAANGIVEIVGKAPGETNIVVVTSAGAQTLAVTVP